MTKAQALALMGALEGQSMPASAVMSFSGTGVESWSVQLDTTHIYNGPQLSKLADYCAANGLSLTLQVTSLGVV